MSVLLINIGELFTGELSRPRSAATSLLVTDGRVAAFDPPDCQAERVIDVRGGAVLPGLVDGHVHPSFGEWTPAQDSLAWIGNYLHGGTTTMVSAGELHIPGLDVGSLDAELVTSLAVVSARTTGRVRHSGAHVHAGTVLLVAGMQRQHFDRLAEAGCRFAKFIFYPFATEASGDAEALQYIEWCHERQIMVKTHTGGVSRSGASRPVGADLLLRVQPDVAAHVTGGPIPMSDADLDRVADETTCFLEVCSSMNFRSTVRLARRLRLAGCLDRLTLGTDTPGGTGVIPRGMLRNILLLASLCDIDPAEAVAIASGNTARAHGLEVGVIDVGRPADIVICGVVRGSTSSTVTESLAHGDLPGISYVLVNGQPVVDGRSRQTPPPAASMSTACCP